MTKLSKPKKGIEFYVDDENKVQAESKLCLSYSIDKESPEILLGTFFSYLQFYCAQLVRHTPKLDKWFNHFQQNVINVPIEKSKIDEIKKSR